MSRKKSAPMPKKPSEEVTPTEREIEEALKYADDMEKSHEDPSIFPSYILATAVRSLRKELEECEKHENCYGPEPIRRLESDLARMREAGKALRSMLLEDGMEGIGWHCRVCGVSMDLEAGEVHEPPCPGAALTPSVNQEKKA